MTTFWPETTRADHRRMTLDSLATYLAVIRHRLLSQGHRWVIDIGRKGCLGQQKTEATRLNSEYLFPAKHRCHSSLNWITLLSVFLSFFLLSLLLTHSPLVFREISLDYISLESWIIVGTPISSLSPAEVQAMNRGNSEIRIFLV